MLNVNCAKTNREAPADHRIIQLSLRSIHRVRVRTNKRQKINGLLSPRAEAGQENIETVHEPKPIQTAGSPCMDRVAVLWEAPTAHRPRYVKGPVPSR